MQCDRHERALLSYVDAKGLMPRRLGFRLRPTMRSFVLVNPTAKVLRPEGYDTSRVVKADQVMERIHVDVSSQGILGLALDASKVLSWETMQEIAEALVGAYVPAEHDYEGMLGIEAREVRAVAPRPSVPPTPAPTPTPQPDMVPPKASGPGVQAALACKGCASERGEIRYGKFGYYWKCLSCDTNTKLTLPGPGKLRKEGPTFTYVDPSGAEAPFHVNAPA